VGDVGGRQSPQRWGREVQGRPPGPWTSPCRRRATAARRDNKDHPVIIEGNRAVTEQKMTIVKPDGTRVVMPFNTNHFTFEGDLIKTLRVMGSPA